MKYELTIVLDGKSTTAKKKTADKKIKELIKVFSGKVIKSDDWGEKELAYPINKSDSGVFLHYEVELDADKAKDLPNKLKLEEDYIRFLIVKK